MIDEMKTPEANVQSRADVAVPCAVVTGSSRGIGAAIIEELDRLHLAGNNDLTGTIEVCGKKNLTPRALIAHRLDGFKISLKEGAHAAWMLVCRLRHQLGTLRDDLECGFI